MGKKTDRDPGGAVLFTEPESNSDSGAGFIIWVYIVLYKQSRF